MCLLINILLSRKFQLTYAFDAVQSGTERHRAVDQAGRMCNCYTAASVGIANTSNLLALGGLDDVLLYKIFFDAAGKTNH